MSPESFLPAVAAVVQALLLMASVYIYVALARQISVRAVDPAAAFMRNFDWPEAVLAALLFFWLLRLAGLSSEHTTRMGTRELVASGILTIGLLLFVAIFLRLRRIDLILLGGFSKIGFWRTATTGVVLMVAAYSLILLADVLTQKFLRGGNERQAIIDLFNASNTLEQRILIIVLAVTIAPVAEEFLFRFFLYGVVKRYLGRVVAVVVSALLFAAVHADLPSFAPLFVLGACFAIAYEWSGSILVSMTMHACFNAITLTALAFPELNPQ